MIDDFTATLFEEAKRFLEKAKDSQDKTAIAANLHAALFLASCALEGYVNSIASDFLTRTDLSVHERGFLAEREVRCKDGEFSVSEILKIVRLEDRIEFLCAKYGKKQSPKREAWWPHFKDGIALRNDLTHPRTAIEVTPESVERYLSAIIELLVFLFRQIYGRKFPASSRRLTSKLTF